MSTLYLQPAYGRKYKTIEEAQKDWNDGKDFKIIPGPYLSIRDLSELKSGYDSIVVLVNDNFEELEINEF